MFVCLSGGLSCRSVHWGQYETYRDENITLWTGLIQGVMNGARKHEFLTERQQSLL